MKNRHIGLPDHMLVANPFLPDEGDGTNGDTSGGTGAEAEQRTDPGTSEVKIGPNGFPLNTPWREMSPEHQAAYWQHQAKKHETEAKTNKSRLAELEPKAAQFEALAEASKSDAERAVEEAEKRGREAGRAEAAEMARSTFGARLVEAEFVASLVGRMDRAAVSTIVSKLNVAAFLDEAGTVNTEAVNEYVAAMPMPAQQTATATSVGNGAARAIGQGARPNQKTGAGLDAGAALWESRHSKTKS